MTGEDAADGHGGADLLRPSGAAAMAMYTSTMTRFAVLATDAVTAPVALIVIVASSL